MKKHWNVIRAIGRVTFFDIVRDKLLYNVVLCTFLLFVVGLLASRLAVFRQDRVMVDMGATLVAASSMAIAILSGASMVSREYDRRTVLVALSRPISRFDFIVGKYFGLSLVLLLNWVLLFSTLLLMLVLNVPSAFSDVVGVTFVWGLFLALIQALLVGGLAVFFSSFTTTSLSVIFSLGLYLIGSNSSQVRWLAARLAPPGNTILGSLSVILPNFEHFHLGTRLTYGLPLGWKPFVIAPLYGLVWVALLLVAAGLLLRRREV